MDTVLVIVTDVIANQPAQVIFIQDDHKGELVIQGFTATRTRNRAEESVSAKAVFASTPGYSAVRRQSSRSVEGLSANRRSVQHGSQDRVA